MDEEVQKALMPAAPPGAVILADVPERVELRRIVRALEAQRDRIAEVDLELETLREQLVGFEATYNARLATESHALGRIEGLVRHLERWAELLHARPAATLGKRAR